MVKNTNQNDKQVSET